MVTGRWLESWLLFNLLIISSVERWSLTLSLSLSFYPPSVCQWYSHSDCGPHTPHSTVKTEVEELSHEVFSPISKLNERNISVSKETPTVLTDFLADLFSCFSLVWLIRAGGGGGGCWLPSSELKNPAGVCADDTSSQQSESLSLLVAMSSVILSNWRSTFYVSPFTTVRQWGRTQ